MNHVRARSIRITLFICLIFATNMALASLEKNIWPIWQVHNPLSKGVISHQEWQVFLNQHIVVNEEKINLIDYPKLTEHDKAVLSNYIYRLSCINISHYNRDEQLAYWLNLYNALTVLTVAQSYPVASILEINTTPGLFNEGPWGAVVVTVNGTPLTLDDIHHRIIRPIWNDPRTHYALNNATIGASNLNRQVFQGATIDTQLNDVAFEYINSSRGAHIIDGKLLVSKIYSWFADDFGGNDALLITHLKQFARRPLLSQLHHFKAVNTYVYNWHLNTTISS